MPIQPKQQPPYYTPTTGITKNLVLLLEQDSTNAPTITATFQNTFDETITTGRNSAGSYYLEKPTPFLRLKTLILIQQTDYDGLTLYHAYADDDGKIYIDARLWSSPNWTLQDDIMTDLTINITEYP